MLEETRNKKIKEGSFTMSTKNFVLLLSSTEKSSYYNSKADTNENFINQYSRLSPIFKTPKNSPSST